MTILKLNHELLFEELYTIDGLRKIDSYFIEKLLRKSPSLCNRMLEARQNHNKMHKSEESSLILELAPYLEEFLAELFHVEFYVDKHKAEDAKIGVIYQCNKSLIQKHVLNLKRDWCDISQAKTALMMYGIFLPIKESEVVEAEIDMAKTFLEIYDIANSEENSDWRDYHRTILTHIENYCLWAIFSLEGQRLHKVGALFRVPHKIDYEHLIPHLIERTNMNLDAIIVTKVGKLLTWFLFTANYTLQSPVETIMKNRNALLEYKIGFIGKRFAKLAMCYSGLYTSSHFLFGLKSSKVLNWTFASGQNESQLRYRVSFLSMNQQYRRHRHGFKLNDDGITRSQSMHESNYCLYCHHRDKDSCSHGMKTVDGYKENPLKISLHGCPLEQKISEMHLLRANSNILGALATIVIDNPMVAATGHRICNDCMKACIFSKQTPVDTPSVETSILKDVLNLPFGFEIYSLLTKWNPLNFANYLPSDVGHHRVLVVGMGPAGFTLAHYLLNAGVNVIGIEGLKIEKLSHAFSGVMNDGTRCEFKPIHSVKAIFEKLENRKPRGFGGVMEYGITVRWDKNMLDIIHLMLLRRQHFQMYDGVRFGSNITYDDCKKLGVDHIAFAVGAGSPNIPAIPNILTRGMRMASDFLMSLQLSGAHRGDTILPIQVRMPIVIIGAGLTAIDTATEIMQYYLVQIRKFLQQYDEIGNKLLESLNAEDKAIAMELIEHAKQLKKKSANKLLERWGGVKILYRRSLKESPAYRINHEELMKGFEEGIEFIENATPLEIVNDNFGHCKGVIFEQNGAKHFIEAKSVVVATGTQPNTIVSQEDHRLLGNANISYFGDANPKYNGSVVKAMASAKNEYKNILQALGKPSINKCKTDENEKFNAYVQEVIALTENVVEVIVKAPMAAAHFAPGQFFRLQKYEGNSSSLNGYKFPMEGLALTGAEVKGDCISLIILEVGVSSKLCRTLVKNERVVLMGPTGSPTHIPQNKTVLLIGGGLGNAVLFSIGKKMRKNGCKVIYFAGYKRLQDRFKSDTIEAAADVVVWCCDEGILSTHRPSDIAFHGNIIQAIHAYNGENIQLKDVNDLVVIGSNSLMEAVAKLHKKKFKKCSGIASVNSPMNCMMKEICAQCVQKHRIGRKDIYIYSCKTQDQNLATIDFNHLDKRLSQNRLLEKSANMFYEDQKSKVIIKKKRRQKQSKV